MIMLYLLPFFLGFIFSYLFIYLFFVLSRFSKFETRIVSYCKQPSRGVPQKASEKFSKILKKLL